MQPARNNIEQVFASEIGWMNNKVYQYNDMGTRRCVIPRCIPRRSDRDESGATHIYRLNGPDIKIDRRCLITSIIFL